MLTRNRLIGLALLGVASAASAVEPTPLADDLRDPAALAVREGPTGGYRVVVAEAGAGRFVELTVLGEGVLSRREIGPIEGPRPVGLACYGKRLLVFDERGLSLLPLEGDAEDVWGPKGPSPVGPPAMNATWCFVPGSDGLLRSRLAADRVGEPKRFPTPAGFPLAIAMTPEGYAAVLLGSDKGGAERIAFYDPANPQHAIASYPVEGLVRPVALAYAASGNVTTLLVLDSGGESPGLVRLITSAGGVARGELLAPIDDPIAMVVSPDSVPLVATANGRLLRYDSLVPAAPLPIAPPPRQPND